MHFSFICYIQLTFAVHSFAYVARSALSHPLLRKHRSCPQTLNGDIRPKETGKLLMNKSNWWGFFKDGDDGVPSTEKGRMWGLLKDEEYDDYYLDDDGDGISYNADGSIGKKSKNRVPADKFNTICPCGTRLNYGECCYRLHSGQNEAATALELLQARYTAYAYRIPTYIMKTTLKSGKEWKENARNKNKWIEELNEFSDSYEFVKLEPGPEIRASSYSSFITFTVKLNVRMRPVVGRVNTLEFTEKARFVREGTRWYYESGELDDYLEGATQITEL